MQQYQEMEQGAYATGCPQQVADRNGVLIPMLISGIFNLLMAVGWAFTCVGIILAVPLFLLGIFEIMTYANGQTMPREQLGSRAGVLGVLEICTILTGNIASFICGIIVVVNRGKV